MEIKEQLVEFDQFCQRCQYYDKGEMEDPCFECLNNPYNIDSNRPIKFEEVK